MLIQTHQKRWAQDFLDIKKILREAIPHLDVVVEHIGSTAVPELAAKPIIDIDISFDHPIKFDEIKVKLEAIGYKHNGDQGIKDREAFKRTDPVSKHPVLDTIRHHLYVCPSYSEELIRHIRFRNILRKDKNVRETYQAMKLRMAKEVNQDYNRYVDLKEALAKDWIYDLLDTRS